MSIFDVFKKNKEEKNADQLVDASVAEPGADKTAAPQANAGQGVDMSAMLNNIDTSQMSTMQKMAFKMFQKMSPDQQKELMRKAMNPQNIQKNKDQILKQIDEMVQSGQIQKGQAEAIKSQMGLR
jgi:hypothetical protein